MLINIYRQIVSECRNMENFHIPISDIGLKFNFTRVETQEADEFYRAILSNGDEQIVLRIWGSDHSGELQYKKDTYHNEVKYTNAKGESYRHSYMYLVD